MDVAPELAPEELFADKDFETLCADLSGGINERNDTT